MDILMRPDEIPVDLWEFFEPVDPSAMTNQWLLGPAPSSLEHFASFPPEIPRRCILAGSRPGDTVLDPFLGSGTTALVAVRLGRNAIGVELSETYAEMARRRLDEDAPLWDEPVAMRAPEQLALGGMEAS